MLSTSSYGGTERRRHRMYITRNTEYHFRDAVCVAVRDRRSGTWMPSHLALLRRLGGTVRFHPNGVAIPTSEEPRVGDALFFDQDGRELVTSALCAVDRPAKSLVQAYPDPTSFVRGDAE
jgi:hypothetical protein